VIFLVIVTLVFGFIGVKNVKNFLKATHIESGALYAASASYYVQPDLDSATAKNMDSDFLKSLPDNYISLMNTDVCANYIYEKISSAYSSDYLTKNSEFSVEPGSKTINVESVKKLYKVNRDKTTMVITVYAMAYNEELSRDILKECRNFIETNADDQIKNSYLEFMGETIKTIRSSSELSKDDKNAVKSVDSDSSTKSIIMAVAKNSVIPIVGLTACLIFIILVASAFHPTLNRKSDFCEYDVPIIGEIKS
jgi:hypothetical protein